MKAPKKIYKPQSNFYSDPVDLYLRIKQAKSQFVYYLKKTLLWLIPVGLLVFLVIGLIIGIYDYQHLNINDDPTNGDLGASHGFFTKLIHALENFVWLILRFPGQVANFCSDIFNEIGGSDILKALSTNPDVKRWLGIVSGAAIIFFTIMMIVRAIKISNMNGDEAHAIAKNTPGVFFWAISTMVIVPAIWLFVTTCLVAVIQAIQSIGSDDGSIATKIFYSACDIQSGFNIQAKLPNWETISKLEGYQILELDEITGSTADSFDWFTAFAGWIAGAVVSVLFCWYAIGLLFNALLCYIILIPAIAKWPQDEGGAAEAIRDEMVGNFIHLVFLYVFFAIMAILLSAVDGIQKIADFNGFAKTMFYIIALAAAGFTCFKFAHKAPEFFSAKNQVSYTTWGDTAGARQMAGKVRRGAGTVGAGIGAAGSGASNFAGSLAGKHLESKRVENAHSAYSSALKAGKASGLTDKQARGKALAASNAASKATLAKGSKFSNWGRNKYTGAGCSVMGATKGAAKKTFTSLKPTKKGGK